MSRLGDMARAALGISEQRDASLGSLLGDNARQVRSAAPLPTQETALRNSVWWACLMLRANVISSFPIDVFRPASGGLGIPVKAGPFFSTPDGADLDITEYLFGTSVDLDRYGNSLDIVTGLNAYGKVTEVQPVTMGPGVRALVKDDKVIEWRVGTDTYRPDQVWHQKQYTVKGQPLGLPTLAYSAYTMGLYESAQQFALDWFGMGASPRGVLKSNKSDNVSATVRQAAKDQFKAATMNGDIFVTGREWEWTPAAADAMSPNFLAQQAESSRDVCRFLGVPASMVDVEVSTGNITYANITQANLQWLITQIGPATTRMEKSCTRKATPGPWYVKFNTDALLRMDPQTRSSVLLAQLAAKAKTPTEVRALDNLPPYTDEQLEELGFFAQLGKPEPTTATAERNAS